MADFDQKSATVFAGKVVRKDLVRKVKVGANVPVFVLEYLLGKYCATDDPAAIDAGLRVVNNTLSSNFVRPDEANKAQSMVKDKGKHTFIDKVKVRYISDDDKHWAELKNFGHKYVHVPEHYLRNYNLVELGPRGTGKSYAYQELSPYAILLTGSTTVANLFYNMATGKIGLVGIWDAIGFDEVADLQKMPKEVVTTLKTYCESGMFARGKDALSGAASIAMFGNTNQPVDVMVRSSHLFLPMPDVIREDMAFLDRIHFYI